MIGGAGTGTFEYNGVSLNDGALRVEIQQKPITDEAQRTVVCIETTITAHTVVQADAGTDDTLESIRAALTKQGQALSFSNKGFGDDLDVNNAFAPNTQRDVRWGPVPQMLSWKPIGDDKAAEITWQVTTWLPPICTTSGIVNSAGVMAFNFSIDFAINGRGFTTRTISGYLEIAMTRNGGARNLVDCADVYRELIAFPPPADFKREQKFTVSADKRRLDFVIIDKQLETRKAYPPGVIDIDMDHRASWSRSNGQALILRNTISGEIEIAAHLPRLQALNLFLNIAFQKINKQRAVGTGVLIDNFDMSEKLFGLTFSASISYRVLKSLKDLLGLGFFEDLGTNDQVWKTSVAQAFGPRGYAGLGLQPSADVIVDLCRPQLPYFEAATSRPAEPGYSVGNYRNTYPPVDQSYLQYQNGLSPSRSTPVTRQAPLQTPATDQQIDDMLNQVSFGYPAAGGTNDILQLAGRPRYEVLMIGGGRRVGYEIPRPALASLGGLTPIETDCVFTNWSEGDHFGVPVYGAAWAISYYLPNSPGGNISPKPQFTNGPGGGQTGIS